jgi:phosphatidylglycerophosphatase A
MRWVVKLLASGCFTGYVPRGSGTFASIIACGAWILLSGKSWYPVFPLFFTVTGFMISGYAQRDVFKEHDSPKIVIDEIAGMLVTYISFSFSLRLEGILYLAAGFFLFRILDIVKPFPVKLLQRLKGGAGIMLDDLASAVIANGLIQLIRIIAFR